jgi:hypothetical protein
MREEKIYSDGNRYRRRSGDSLPRFTYKSGCRKRPERRARLH